MSGEILVNQGETVPEQNTLSSRRWLAIPARLELATLCLEGRSLSKEEESESVNDSNQSSEIHGVTEHSESPTGYSLEHPVTELSGENLVNFSGEECGWDWPDDYRFISLI